MEGGAYAPLLFFMAKKALPLVECLEDVLLSYGYSMDDINEALIRLSKHDEIYLELENGNIIVPVIRSYMDANGYQLCREGFELSSVDEEDIEWLITFVDGVLLDIDPKTTRRWVIETIQYIASPNYWKYARIMYILEGVTHLPNDIIPPEVIGAALEEARIMHVGKRNSPIVIREKRRRE